MALHRTLVALAAAGTVCATLLAAPAHADGGAELVYLQTLNNHGIQINNTAGAILRGHQICGWLANRGTAGAVEMLFRSTSRTETPDLGTARVMVNAAAGTLCAPNVLT